MFQKLIKYFKEEYSETTMTEYEKECRIFHSTRKKNDKLFINTMKDFCKTPSHKIILDPDEQFRLYNLASQAWKGQRVSQDDPDIRHIVSRFDRAYDPHKTLTFSFTDYEKKILPSVLEFGFKSGHYSPYG